MEDNNQDKNTSYIEEKKGKLNIVIIILAIIAIIIMFILLFLYNNKTRNTIYNNVYLQGVNISGYTKEELEEYLEEIKFEEYNISILSNDQEIFNINSSDINLEVDVNETLKKSFDFGRDNNILINNINILKNLFGKYNEELIYKYDTEKMEEVLDQIDLGITDRYISYSYYLDEEKEKIIIKNGVSGNSLDKDKFITEILNLLQMQEVKSYEVPTIQVTPEVLNLEDIYDNIVKEPKDAYIEEGNNGIEIFREENGYEFSLEELEKFLNKEENKTEGKELEFEVTVRKADVTLEKLNYSNYNQVLSTFTTYYSTASYNRASNLEVALRYLDNNIILPGETFSVSDTLGNITAAQGYKPASTFKGGKVVQEIGGGVCQTSSTLYNAALLAGLEIVERHPHSLPVGYVKASQDATIYTGVLDLKIKNTRKYPVVIETVYNPSGSINISIHGIKEEVEYTYSINSYISYRVPYKTLYNYDSTMEEGTQKVIVNGSNGYASYAYLTKSLNNEVIEKTLLSEDKYGAINRVVTMGTKEVVEENIIEEELSQEEILPEGEE